MNASVDVKSDQVLQRLLSNTGSMGAVALFHQCSLFGDRNELAMHLGKMIRANLMRKEYNVYWITPTGYALANGIDYQSQKHTCDEAVRELTVSKPTLAEPQDVPKASLPKPQVTSKNIEVTHKPPRDIKQEFSSRSNIGLDAVWPAAKSDSFPDTDDDEIDYDTTKAVNLSPKTPKIIHTSVPHKPGERMGRLKRDTDIGKVALVLYQAGKDTWLSVSVIRRRANVSHTAAAYALSALTGVTGKGKYLVEYAESEGERDTRRIRWSGKYEYPFPTIEADDSTKAESLPQTIVEEAPLEDDNTGDPIFMPNAFTKECGSDGSVRVSATLHSPRISIVEKDIDEVLPDYLKRGVVDGFGTRQYSDKEKMLNFLDEQIHDKMVEQQRIQYELLNLEELKRTVEEI